MPSMCSSLVDAERAVATVIRPGWEVGCSTQTTSASARARIRAVRILRLLPSSADTDAAVISADAAVHA